MPPIEPSVGEGVGLGCEALHTLRFVGCQQELPRRPYTAPTAADPTPYKNAPGLSDRGHWEKMERETGIEPATLSLGSQPKGKK